VERLAPRPGGIADAEAAARAVNAEPWEPLCGLRHSPSPRITSISPSRPRRRHTAGSRRLAGPEADLPSQNGTGLGDSRQAPNSRVLLPADSFQKWRLREAIQRDAVRRFNYSRAHTCTRYRCSYRCQKRPKFYHCSDQPVYSHSMSVMRSAYLTPWHAASIQ
jgi:hypothetical protein